VAGFPLEEATRIMLGTIRAYLAGTESGIEQITLYGYSPRDAEAIRRVVEESGI
jgi:O-acetyl-ADP-ribose deacetylase (regulator of RNase III)